MVPPIGLLLQYLEILLYLLDDSWAFSSIFQKIGKLIWNAQYLLQNLTIGVVIAVLADGCNWGNPPKEAASRAKENFARYVQEHVTEVKNVRVEIPSCL